MFNNAKLKIKAVDEKLLSLVSGGAGLIENIRVKRKMEDREKYNKRKKDAAKRHPFN